MPIAPAVVVTMPSSKPKIGFSIDSIVGSGREKSLSPVDHSDADLSNASMVSDDSMGSPMSIDNDMYRHRSRSRSPRRQSSSSVSPTLDPGNVSPPSGIVRPSALPPGAVGFNKGLFLPDPALMHANQHPHAHFALAAAAAQHFQAAGLAALTNPFLPGGNNPSANGHSHPSAGHPLPPSHPPHGHHPPRESYQLYPWLLSRHGRVFSPARYPGGEYFYNCSFSIRLITARTAYIKK